MSTGSCIVYASADVLGIGIRVNFYATMVLLAMIPRMLETEELLNSLYTNAGIAGSGLLLTAIIQTAQKKLTLFDALFTIHILFFLGTGASPMGKYHWTKSRVYMGILVQFVSVITFTAWGLYVWINVQHFGEYHECNDKIKYVVFFISVRATAPWLRGIWITGIVLSAVGLMLSFGWNAMQLLEMKRMAEEEQAEDINRIARREVTVTPGAGLHAETVGKVEEKEWYFDISFTLLFSAVYSTVMLELTVHRNLASGVVNVDNKWQFGQVLAVVMIIANANEIVHFFVGLLARRNRRLDRERQAESEEIAIQPEEHSSPTFYRPRGPSGPNLSTRGRSTNKISTGYELQNLDKRDDVVSETIIVSNVQPQDHPIDSLR